MPPIQALKRLAPLWLVLAVVLGFALQGTRGLYDTTEGRYAEAAREMLVTGDWWMPRLEGTPHLTKPPLTYWAIASGMALLGQNAWGVRLYGALAFIVSAAGVAALGRRLWDAETGTLAGLVYATALFPAAAANIASTDVLLAMWEILAVLAYWLALTAESGRARWYVRAMWLALGLGFFTKGYPVLLPLLAIGAFHTLERRRGATLPRLLDGPGIVAFLVAGGWWYAGIALRDPDTLTYFIRDELVARVASNEFHRNPEWYKPFLLYLPALTLGLGLWLLAWPLALRCRGLLWDGWRALWRRSRPVRFLVWWLALPLLVFSLAQSRLPLYVLPLFPVSALATARLLATSAGVLRRRGVVTGLAIAAAVLVVGLKAGVAAYPASVDKRALAQVVAQRAGAEGTVLLLDRDDNFGLTFYRQGNLRRIVSATTHRGSLPLAEAVARTRAGGFAAPVVFVAGHRYADLDQACAAQEAACTRESPRHGTVLYTFARP